MPGDTYSLQQYLPAYESFGRALSQRSAAGAYRDRPAVELGQYLRFKEIKRESKRGNPPLWRSPFQRDSIDVQSFLGPFHAV
jgi:hypothetical protein